jgi:hypothetical protein
MTDKVWINGYKSGHCIAGRHEGAKQLSMRGALLPACNGAPCGCECHGVFDQMAEFIKEQLGADVVVPTAPAIALSPRSNVPTPVAANVTVATDRSTAARTHPGLPPDHPGDEPQSTGNGRRARGSLDWEVKKVCDAWVSTGTDVPLTPKMASALIDGGQTSTGAVDAVWRRWVQIGFAITASKPTRFIGYTEKGIEKGLHRIKFEKKKAVKGERYTW